MLIKILKKLWDFPWRNAESWGDGTWLKEIPIFLPPFSYLFPYPLPPTSCMTTAVDQTSIYSQILLSTDKYILSHSHLIYHSPAAARLQQRETFWLVGLPCTLRAHPSMCWLPKNVGELKTSLHNVRTQWSNPILCQTGIKIYVHKPPLSKPNLSTTVKQWDNGNFPCCFLLCIDFLFHRNLLGFSGFFNSLRKWRCAIQSARKQIIYTDFADKSWGKSMSTVNKIEKQFATTLLPRIIMWINGYVVHCWPLLYSLYTIQCWMVPQDQLVSWTPISDLKWQRNVSGNDVYLSFLSLLTVKTKALQQSWTCTEQITANLVCFTNL